MKAILLRLLLKLKILKHLNFTLEFERLGKKYKIPIIASVGIEHLSAEKESWMVAVLRTLNQITQGEGSFLDVGANIGQTLLKVKSCNDQGEYIGFEPNPHCLQYLYHLVEANRFPNIQLLPFGLSDQSTASNLHLSTGSLVDTSATLVDGFRAKVFASLVVPVISSSDILHVFRNPVTIIKIDVEGGELEVLKGLQRIIERDRPYIICEILPVYNKGNEFRLNRQVELEELMTGYQYLKFRIGPDGDLSPCEEIGIQDSLKDINYLLCPKIAHETIQKHFQVHS